MNTSKGQTMTSFINYFLCQGQQDALALRYAPLPVNLVELGLGVEQQVPGSVPPASVSHCNNPAITQNWYAKNGIGLPTVKGTGPGASTGGGSTPGAAPGATAAAAGGAKPSASSTGPAANGGAGTGPAVAAGPTSRSVAAQASGHAAPGAATSTAGATVRAGAGNTNATTGGSSATKSQQLLASARPGTPPHFGSQWGPSWWVALVIGLVVVGLALGPPAINLRRRAARAGGPAQPRE